MRAVVCAVVCNDIREGTGMLEFWALGRDRNECMWKLNCYVWCIYVYLERTDFVAGCRRDGWVMTCDIFE